MAAFNPTSDTDSAFRVSRSTDTSLINSFGVRGTVYRMYARATTTVVEYRGLSRSQALAMAENVDYNYIDKHGVRYDKTSPLAWMAAPDCEGTECRADAHRINEADMWRVIVTHISTTVWHSDSTWTRSTF